MAQDPTLNHTITIWYDPKSPGKQRLSYQAGHSQGLMDTFQEQGKGETSFGAKVTLYCTGRSPIIHVTWAPSHHALWRSWDGCWDGCWDQQGWAEKGAWDSGTEA